MSDCQPEGYCYAPRWQALTSEATKASLHFVLNAPLFAFDFQKSRTLQMCLFGQQCCRDGCSPAIKLPCKVCGCRELTREVKKKKTQKKTSQFPFVLFFFLHGVMASQSTNNNGWFSTMRTTYRYCKYEKDICTVFYLFTYLFYTLDYKEHQGNKTVSEQSSMPGSLSSLSESVSLPLRVAVQ